MHRRLLAAGPAFVAITGMTACSDDGQRLATLRAESDQDTPFRGVSHRRREKVVNDKR